MVNLSIELLVNFLNYTLAPVSYLVVDQLNLLLSLSRVFSFFGQLSSLVVQSSKLWGHWRFLAWCGVLSNLKLVKFLTPLFIITS